MIELHDRELGIKMDMGMVNVEVDCISQGFDDGIILLLVIGG